MPDSRFPKLCWIFPWAWKLGAFPFCPGCWPPGCWRPLSAGREGSSDPGMTARQIGHVFWTSSQGLIHASWKQCSHGNWETSSSAANSVWQIEHGSPALQFSPTAYSSLPLWCELAGTFLQKWKLDWRQKVGIQARSAAECLNPFQEFYSLFYCLKWFLRKMCKLDPTEDLTNLLARETTYSTPLLKSCKVFVSSIHGCKILFQGRLQRTGKGRFEVAEQGCPKRGFSCYANWKWSI